MNGIAHSKVNARGISRALCCSLALIFMPLSGAGPTPKPAAVKRVTVDEVLAMSAIATYTDLEDMELGKVSNSPKKTRDLLVRMHIRRERSAKSLLDKAQYDPDCSRQTENVIRTNYLAFQSARLDLQALKL